MKTIEPLEDLTLLVVTCLVTQKHKSLSSTLELRIHPVSLERKKERKKYRKEGSKKEIKKEK